MRAAASAAAGWAAHVNEATAGRLALLAPGLMSTSSFVWTTRLRSVLHRLADAAGDAAEVPSHARGLLDASLSLLPKLSSADLAGLLLPLRPAVGVLGGSLLGAPPLRNGSVVDDASALESVGMVDLAAVLMTEEEEEEEEEGEPVNAEDKVEVGRRWACRVPLAALIALLHAAAEQLRDLSLQRLLLRAGAATPPGATLPGATLPGPSPLGPPPGRRAPRVAARRLSARPTRNDRVASLRRHRRALG